MILIIIVIIFLIYHLCKRESPTVIYYTNPRCPYCINFDPIWNELTSTCSRAKFRKIDCLANPHLCQIANDRFQLKSTPHLVIIRGQNYEVFSGDRNLQNLKKWIG